jgi:hypothetical protein
MTVDAAGSRRKWIFGPCTVRPALELFADVVVAHGAICGLEIFFVRQLDPIEVPVTIDAAKIGMNRRRERFGIDKDRDLEVALLADQIRVFVAHQTVFVLLCRHRYDLNREQKSGANNAQAPQSSESSFFIADQVHSLLQIRAESIAM